MQRVTLKGDIQSALQAGPFRVVKGQCAVHICRRPFTAFVPVGSQFEPTLCAMCNLYNGLMSVMEHFGERSDAYMHMLQQFEGLVDTAGLFYCHKLQKLQMQCLENRCAQLRENLYEATFQGSPAQAGASSGAVPLQRAPPLPPPQLPAPPWVVGGP